MDTHQAEETTVSLENKCASWLKSALGAGDSNLEKDELRKDAKQVFCSIAASASLAADIREASLAKLLKYLGPGLTEKLTSRICSLSIILGAIEGLQGAELSLGTANLLASFFLEQCAPLDDHSVNFGEDYVEQIRDLSLGCLSNLMKCKLGTTANPTESISAIKLLCTTSRQAVERRCALSDDDEDYQSFGLTGMGAMAGGLSNLPRSRRSLCFELLQSAVDGVDRIVAESSDLQHSGLPSKLATELPSFVTFVCSCLQGESDPRCLLQLLVLFRKIQVAFESIFKAGKLSSFPITTMFDAVAPYYPINFTPPPHDNHGITQMALKDALMSVLSGFGYDGLATQRGDTMVNLSVGIVLERLVPLEGGDDTNLASSTDEKQEAVDDISLLLFSHGESMVDGLVKESVSLLSKALVCTHHEAAIAVSRGGSCKKENKLVADTCRSLVAKIAFQVEGNKSLWNIFVRDAVVGMATKLDSNSMEGRTAVAYLASLATSGAPQTLRFVLDKSLEKCIRKMKESMNDEESATLAAYGIGAFFSACNVAVERAKKRGVLFHPHPTENFCSSALLVLSEIILDKEKSEPLKTAALLALESLLGACPSEYFDESQKETLCQVLTDMAAGIAEATEAADFSQEYIMASAKTLGALIGGAFVPVDEEEPLSNKVVVSQQIQDLLKAKLMANLLSRSTQFISNRTQQRYDRIALARACSSNDTAAASILEALLSSLKQSMKLHSLSDQSFEHLMAINAVIRESGPGAQRAFHSSQTVFDIIDKLCSLDPRTTGDENKAMDMTALNLPPTETELVGAMRKTQEVVTLLLPAYQTCLPQEVFLSYLSMISKVLPPLSSEDTTRLAIVLPLLSAALEKGTLPLPDDPSFHSAADLFASIGCDLANYAIGSEYEARSRTGAAACLHAYITNFRRDTNVCPAQQLLKDVAIPNLLLAYDNLRNAPKGKLKGKLNEEHFVDCLNLCMNLGSAAACRGGISASTADEMASFVILLSCNSKAVVPFSTKRDDCEMDFLALSRSSENSTYVSVVLCAVAAFGSMLRDDRRPLWKQRLAHKTLKSLEPAMQAFQENGAKSATDTLGLTTILCSLVCESNLKSISLAKKGDMMRILVSSLSSGLFSYVEKDLEMEQQLGEVKRMAIASLLRLSVSNPGLLSSYSESIMLGLLRAYATADIYSDIACKVLILQAIERICHLEVRKKVLVTMKPAVVSILGAAMNHPSRLMRTAALSVRNAWSTIHQD